jgi:hypothetical protein
MTELDYQTVATGQHTITVPDVGQRVRAVLAGGGHTVRVTCWAEADGWHYSLHIDGKQIDAGSLEEED